MVIETREVIKMVNGIKERGNAIDKSEWIKKIIEIVCDTIIEGIKSYEETEMQEMAKQ
jgi:hypothetical protein